MSAFEFHHQFNLVSAYLMRFALSLTKNSEDAKDLYQEATYLALRHKDKFTPGTNFKSWITTILRNTFINEYHRRSRRQTTSEPIDSPAFIHWAGSTQNSAIADMTSHELNGLIDGLSEKTRVPFLLSMQGFQYEEIAQQLELPLGTVKSRIFMARQALQKKIKVLNPALAEQYADKYAEKEVA